MSTSSFESVNFDEFSLDNPINRCAGQRSRLVYLSQDSAHFAEVETLFKKGWRRGRKAKPQIQGIFKILWPDSNLEPYLQYRKQVQAHVRSRNSAGNEKLLFHGTNRACLLGESSNNVLLCSLKECYLCSILRSSFDVKKCGTKNAFKRFGHGIYTTAYSSKADDYSLNLSQDACLRTMLVNRVVVGRPYKRFRNACDLVKPPDDFDSVTGEIAWRLGHGEIVCYTNDAVRPAYLIVYGHKPKDSSKPSFEKLMSTIFKTPLISMNVADVFGYPPRPEQPTMTTLEEVRAELDAIKQDKLDAVAEEGKCPAGGAAEAEDGEAREEAGDREQAWI